MNQSKMLSAFKMPLEQADEPHFELNGSRQFLADGCVGVLHYDETKVCLNCGKEIVEIGGCALTFQHLGNAEAEIKGNIHSVKFV